MGGSSHVKLNITPLMAHTHLSSHPNILARVFLCIIFPPGYHQIGTDYFWGKASFLNLNGTRAGSYISRRASIPERASKSGRTFVYPGELIIYFIVHFSRWFRLLVVAWRWLGSPVLSKGRVSTGKFVCMNDIRASFHIQVHLKDFFSFMSPRYGRWPGYGSAPRYGVHIIMTVFFSLSLF